MSTKRVAVAKEPSTTKATPDVAASSTSAPGVTTTEEKPTVPPSADSVTTDATDDSDEGEETMRRVMLPRHNFSTMREDLVPVDVKTAEEALRFLFCSKAWHEDPDLLHRKVRRWKGTIYDDGWELEAKKLRAENPSRWTYSRLAKKFEVTKAAVRTLFRADLVTV